MAADFVEHAPEVIESAHALARAAKRWVDHAEDSFTDTSLVILFREIEKHNARRIANRRVMAGEGQRALVPVHAEHRDVVAPLVAAIKELAGGIEVEAPGIVSARPFLADEG